MSMDLNSEQHGRGRDNRAHDRERQGTGTPVGRTDAQHQTWEQAQCNADVLCMFCLLMLASTARRMHSTVVDWQGSGSDFSCSLPNPYTPNPYSPKH